ncbi:hypothetical protein IF2G_04989 [Cordyceps javanica]|nr:hypothetical protein IF2G_04989 [Cordyceps javanica]
MCNLTWARQNDPLHGCNGGLWRLGSGCNALDAPSERGYARPGSSQIVRSCPALWLAQVCQVTHQTPRGHASNVLGAPGAGGLVQ